MKEDELRAFFVAERQRFISYARSLLTDTGETDPEDVVQDVFLKLVERGDTPPLDNFVGYVFRSLRNRVIDLARTRKPTLSIDDEAGQSGLTLMEVLRDARPGALEMLQSLEGQRALFAALDRLSGIERQVIIAHEFEGTAFRELAEQTGVPLNTLLSHKSRGLRKLRDDLLDNEETRK